MYNFDEIKDRRGTSCIKYDSAVRRGRPADILPLWVADMDFPVPPEVEDAMIERVRHGIFGYTQPEDDYYNAVINWFGERHGYEFTRREVVHIPGIVFAINMAIQAYTEKGDAVLVQKPVYYPFFHSTEDNGRRVVNNSLVHKDGKYQIDFEDFEEKIRTENVKLFILCSPHNPAGRVWTREELERMGDICLKYGVKVVADEIHCDFVYEPAKHIPFVTVKEEYKKIAITCTSPSKTFNMAGLQVANIIIHDRQLRRAFKDALNCTGYCEISVMGMAACQAAYEKGAPWLKELHQYIKGNIDYIREFLKERLPKIKLVEPEGTYLVWLDCRELGLTAEELNRRITFEGKIWLDDGTMFGEEGAGYQRINVTTNRVTIEKAMLALERVLK